MSLGALEARGTLTVTSRLSELTFNLGAAVITFLTSRDLLHVAIRACVFYCTGSDRKPTIDHLESESVRIVWNVNTLPARPKHSVAIPRS